MDGQPQFDISKLSATDRNELNQFLQNETQKSSIQQSTLPSLLIYIDSFFFFWVLDENCQMTSIHDPISTKPSVRIYEASKLTSLQPSTTSLKSASKSASPEGFLTTDSTEPKNRAHRTVSRDGWMPTYLLSSIWRLFVGRNR